MIKRHTVLLGAGATMAAIPNGDKNGKKSSVMNNLFSELGMNYILKNVHLHTSSKNLEDIYSELASRPEHKDVVQVIEKSLYDYFASLEIPDYPTIYDYLILSLTGKDVIATFNWDPFLVQAIGRAQKYTNNIPQVCFLHGNVAVGFCEKDNIMGNIGMICRCGNALRPMKLLFPVKNKDYNSDMAISKSWKTLNNALEVAYMVTIFGYSAPKSDVEAVSMMKKAWGSVDKRNLEEIEIIDIRDEEEIVKSWNQFIHTHHYSYHTNFFESTLARCPRRTCEATFDRLMNCIWLDGSKGFKHTMKFSDIDKLTSDLIKEEGIVAKANANGKHIFLSNPYH